MALQNKLFCKATLNSPTTIGLLAGRPRGISPLSERSREHIEWTNWKARTSCNSIPRSSR